MNPKRFHPLRALIAIVLSVLFAVGCVGLLRMHRDSPPPEIRASDQAGAEVVILLHGLMRTPRSLQRMQTTLTEAGYAVYTLPYPSAHESVEHIADTRLAPFVETCERELRPARIHFVAHSLGNIVLRRYLSAHSPARMGRIVMLGPPNQGSEIVDRLRGLRLYRWIVGPAGQQLGTDADSLPHLLPIPDAEVGVLAGVRTVNPIFSWMIPGPDDGKVAVEHTRLPGMADFATVRASHTFIMRNPEAIRLTLLFLQKGTFHE